MKTKNQKAASAAFAILGTICILSLSLISLDCESYRESTAACAITYTPPGEPSEKGFWDIVADSLSLLFFSET